MLTITWTLSVCLHFHLVSLRTSTHKNVDSMPTSYCWSQIEPSTAFICACITTYRPLFKDLTLPSFRYLTLRSRSSCSDSLNRNEKPVTARAVEDQKGPSTRYYGYWDTDIEKSDKITACNNSRSLEVKPIASTATRVDQLAMATSYHESSKTDFEDPDRGQLRHGLQQ